MPYALPYLSLYLWPQQEIFFDSHDKNNSNNQATKEEVDRWYSDVYCWIRDRFGQPGAKRLNDATGMRFYGNGSEHSARRNNLERVVFRINELIDRIGWL